MDQFELFHQGLKAKRTIQPEIKRCRPFETDWDPGIGLSLFDYWPLKNYVMFSEIQHEWNGKYETFFWELGYDQMKIRYFRLNRNQYLQFFDIMLQLQYLEIKGTVEFSDKLWDLFKSLGFRPDWQRLKYNDWVSMQKSLAEIGAYLERDLLKFNLIHESSEWTHGRDKILAIV